VSVDLVKQRVSTLNIAQTRTSHSDAQKALELEAYGGRVNKSAGVRSGIAVFGCSLLSRNKRSLGRLGNPSEGFFPDGSGARMGSYFGLSTSAR
jgi:hypothetical protein